METTSKLSGVEVKRLQDALVAAFPTRSALAQVVRVGLEANLEAIAAEKNLSDSVFELIRWAEAQGRLDDLVAAARRANSGNPELHAFVGEWGTQFRAGQALVDGRYVLLEQLDRGRKIGGSFAPTSNALEAAKLDTTIAPASTPQSHKPEYENDEVRALAEQLEQARCRKKVLKDAGASSTEVDHEILDLRRRLREGGHLRAGDTLEDGRYLLLTQIGRGGFASVWAVLDRECGQRVAIKVLHADQAREPSRRERFFRGARVMAQLDHPAVVRVLNPHGEDGGYHYFVMELVEGEDLHHAVLGGHVPHEATVRLILPIGDALAEAHAKGIVHRDVKPSNILLDKSRAPRLTDFDLVAAKDTTGGTRTGAMGTFLFTAPEQIQKAKEADARADVYGLGMTAIFCLHGGDLPETALRNPEVVIAQLPCSDAVKHVLTRAIEVNPDQRFLDAHVFCEALRRATTRGFHATPQRSAARIIFPGLAVVTTGVALLCSSRISSFGCIAPHPIPPSPIPLVRSPEPSPSTVDAARSAADAVPPPNARTNAAHVPPDASPTDACPEGMVFIPAGDFIWGAPLGPHFARQSKEHAEKPFCIDRMEVTVSAYQACEATKKCTASASFSDGLWDCSAATNNQIPPGDRASEHPITCVTWKQGDIYCKAVGKRLPTEMEWEHAARGEDGRKYPWGDAPYPGPELLNACDQRCKAYLESIASPATDVLSGNDGYPTTSTVGHYRKGASPFNVLDMAGNVAEWVDGFDCDSKSDSCDKGNRVVRGGSWRSGTAVQVQTNYRDSKPDKPYNFVGFRCARSL